MCLESLYDVILEKVYLSDIRPHINSGGVHGLIELAEMSTSGKIGNSLDCSMWIIFFPVFVWKCSANDSQTGGQHLFRIIADVSLLA